MPMDQCGESLTEKEVAAILRISPVTLREWRTGRRPNVPRLPYRKFGKSVRYDLAAIKKFIADSERLPFPDSAA